ncbi:hypothetical protein [Actinoplanes philippinensis]|uniref:hypothetical protein n=1 Tax=Actinoplanes philippinensis TaxID=35752 RepID=UPI0033C7D940
MMDIQPSDQIAAADRRVRTRGAIRQAMHRLAEISGIDRQGFGHFFPDALEEERRRGAGPALRWVLDGETVGPLTDGPVTARRAVNEARLARHLIRHGAVPGRSAQLPHSPRTQGEVLGVAQAMEWVLGEAEELILEPLWINTSHE